MAKVRPRFTLLRDIGIIGLSVAVAILIVQSGVVHKLLAATEGFGVLTSLIAGAFFASIFTAAPAGVVLGELSETLSIYTVAFFGALGCLLSDVTIMSLMKRSVVADADGALRHSPLKKLYDKIRKNNFLRGLSVIVGAAIVVSPFPDEIGLLLMGSGNVSRRILIPLIFVLDFLGILLIGWIVKAV